MHIHPLYVLAGAALVGATIALLRRQSAPQGRDFSTPWPVTLKRRLLTPVELELYERLVQSLPEYRIFAQVSLRQLLELRGWQRNWKILNQFAQLSMDFVVVTPDAVAIVGIELDDTSHARSDRQDADARKTHALRSAGLPLIRWTTRTLPDRESIKSAVAQAVRNPHGR